MTSTVDSKVVQTRPRGAVAIALLPGASSFLHTLTVHYEEHTRRLGDLVLVLYSLRFSNKCWQMRLFWSLPTGDQHGCSSSRKCPLLCASEGGEPGTELNASTGKWDFEATLVKRSDCCCKAFFRCVRSTAV